jgi:hypothetical protein
MLERYKVLGAMLALKQFTVEEIARFSEVSPTTVRTVLSREGKYLKEIGRKATGQPGGQFVQYEVYSERIPQLRSELEELFRTVWSTASMVDSMKLEIIPLSLMAVEDALLHQYPAAKDRQERRHILNVSVSALGGAEVRRLRIAHREQGLDSRLAAHLTLAAWLTHLAAAEYAIDAGHTPDLSRLVLIRHQLEYCSRTFHESGQGELARLITERVLKSSVMSSEVRTATAEVPDYEVYEVPSLPSELETYEERASFEPATTRDLTRKG